MEISFTNDKQVLEENLSNETYKLSSNVIYPTEKIKIEDQVERVEKDPFEGVKSLRIINQPNFSEDMNPIKEDQSSKCNIKLETNKLNCDTTVKEPDKVERVENDPFEGVKSVRIMNQSNFSEDMNPIKEDQSSKCSVKLELNELNCDTKVKEPNKVAWMVEMMTFAQRQVKKASDAVVVLERCEEAERLAQLSQAPSTSDVQLGSYSSLPLNVLANYLDIFNNSQEGSENWLDNVLKRDQASTCPDDIQSDTLFYCNECLRAFNCKKTLIIHLKTHQEKNFCKDTSTLTNRVFVGKRPHVCDKCCKPFFLESNFRLHQLLKMCNKSKARCNECNKIFSKEAKLLRHYKMVHIGSRPFICQECGKRFPDRSVLMIHTRRKHSMTIKSFSCKICRKPFFDSKSLSNHQVVHTGNKPFSCNVCLKKFSFETNMKRHCKAIHLKLKPFTCDYCDSSFSAKSSLKSHQKVHGNEKQPVVSCLKCNIGFRSKSGLINHNFTVHGIEPVNYSCGTCNKKFTCKLVLKEHIKYVHVNKNQYFSCEFCQKTFKREVNLKNHKKIHLEPSFYCIYCKKTFLDILSFRLHFKDSKKKQKRTHTCQKCGKGHQSPCDLQCHIHTYHSESAYNCCHCDKWFSSRHLIRKHVNRAHTK